MPSVRPVRFCGDPAAASGGGPLSASDRPPVSFADRQQIFLAAPAAWRQERPVLVMAASSAEECSAVVIFQRINPSALLLLLFSVF